MIQFMQTIKKIAQGSIPGNILLVVATLCLMSCKEKAPDGGDGNNKAPAGGDASSEAPAGGDASGKAPAGGDASSKAPDGGDASKAASGDTVKVGVLHSLSGTMAISETSLRDVLLFTFDEINAAGGVLGQQIEPVVADGASDWPNFAEKAKQLLLEDEVSVTFGCWTSVSRKFVLPVFEENKGLLFYPVQYEGEEMSPNIFYTAEAVNQQAIPAVDYLLEAGKKKFYLVGTDYVYPQTTNLVLFEYLLSKGIAEEDIGGGLRKQGGKTVGAGKYTPFSHTDYQAIVGEIEDFAAGGDACVINTINGDSNVPFFKEFAASGLTAEDCPVVSFSVSEDEFRSLPTKDLVGHLGCWTYFMSLDTPANNKFTKAWGDWLAKTNATGIVKENRVTCSPMVLSYNGVYLWKAAVEKAGTFDPTAVMKALEEGISFDGPAGTVTSQKNHHLTKNVYIGETRSNGQFKVVKSFENVVGEPFLKGTFK
jgi:urea transport system substrate-binding protein